MNNTDLKQISELLDNRLDNKLAPIQKTLEQHGAILESHGKILESHGNILRSLKKDQSVMLAMLDGEQMKQRKRLKRVEEHLGITSPIS